MNICGILGLQFLRRKLALGCIAILWAPLAGRSQNSPQSPPLVDFSNDPCGNPMIESQLWLSVEGTVSEVIDGRTLLVVASENRHTVRVRIAGVTIEEAEYSKKAKAFLEDKLKSTTVNVWVIPEEWRRDRLPRRITAAVYPGKGGADDVASMLLAQGLARFEPPQPYTVSHYTQCQYRRTEAEAKSKGLGLWE